MTLVKFADPDKAPPAPPPRRPPHVVLDDVDGGSPRGSSHHRQIRGCPREYALAKIVKLRPGTDNEALTVGWIFHKGLESYYYHWLHNPQSTIAEREAQAWANVGLIATEPGYEETWKTVERILGSYFDHYRQHDNWRILAVEETLIAHRPDVYSARLDLVIENLDDGGTWIVEHKSARAISSTLLEGYQLDLQVLGQAWLFQRCVDLKKYPPFRGVIVNITSKAMTPRHERVHVMPSHYHMEAFERQLASWKRILPVYAQEGYPQDFSKCTRNFRRCTYFDLCHAFPAETVVQLMQKPAPFGYSKDGDEVLLDDTVE